MNLLALIGALIGASLAVAALGLAHRLRPAPPEGAQSDGPHPALSTIGAGLLSGFVLLTGFLVATGWAGRTTHVLPPRGLYVADVAAATAVLVYPALAGLPFTGRHAAAVGSFAALVGYTVAMALQLRV